ncbi:hypothetical protein E5F05_10695 [Deinococcus metallilatus]|uniref:Uncharacterized protein n=1 Tax=Deinococcus metallilatus TaxID=1211322 RepID=A0AAJ5JXW6_9DEIO|nr:hypothetical protein [Deinococcus metallilatus]MBB5296618.1 hypothetical protein [Deinococcus metallilatus]QBY08363.1 hypothetical protein E5F05_10695 [Deinococcus metallilatus]RXJ11162.1 hypothetical protein ERJ73_09515 [Deinococcus metallilatus]TLK24653.1 hypothetical protein FCS05_13950 [Deinococcus metallilatus]
MAKNRRRNALEEKMIQQGAQNAELLPQLTNWCAHLTIKQHSRGLLAEVTGLPIGMMGIECVHAPPGGMMGHDLHFVAQDFVVRSCDGCPHHAPVGSPSAGHVILEQHRASAKAPPPHVEDAKRHLRELVRGDVTNAFHTEHVTVQSVLQFVLLLDDETRHEDAASKLIAASRVAPELFIEVAVEVLCSHFPDKVHGVACIQTVTNLTEYTSARSVHDVALEAARWCVQNQRNADAAARLLGLHVQTGGQLVDDDLDALLAAQMYRFHWRNHDGGHDYAGCTFALEQVYAVTPDAVALAFERRLCTNDKQVRVDTFHALAKLLPGRHELGWTLAQAMIDSLELDDDGYEEPADAMACTRLASLYCQDPARLQGLIDAAIPVLSDEAYVELLGVHERVLRRAARDQDAETAPEAPVALAIQFLLHVLGDPQVPLEARSKAALTLRDASAAWGSVLLPHLDALLAALVLCVQERKTDQGAPATLLEGIQRQADASARRLIQQGLASALDSVTHLAPGAVLERLDDITPNLRSLDAAESAVKAELATLYGTVGEQRHLAPQVIPSLYRLLTDFDSVLVRANAISSVSRMLHKHPDSVPPNMTDLLVTYLNDQYVLVCQRAAAAMLVLEPRDEAQLVDIFKGLLVLNTAFVQQDPYTLRDLRQPLFRIARQLGNDTDDVIGQILVLHSQHKDQYVARDALRDFAWHVTPAWAPQYLKTALSHLERKPPDVFNAQSLHDDELFRSFFQLPRDVIAAHVAAIQKLAVSYAKVFEHVRFALEVTDLLVYFELYGDAARVASGVAHAQPPTRRHAWLARRALMICATCQTEAFTLQDRPSLALDAANDAARLAEQEDDEYYLDHDDARALAGSILDRADQL